MDYTFTQLFTYFAKYFKPYRSILIIGTLYRVINSVIWLYSSFALAEVITFVTKYHKGDDLTYLYTILISWLFVIQIRFICIYVAKILCLNVAEKVSMNVEIDSIQHLSLLDISWHEKENAGNKIKRIQRGSNGIVTLVRVWIVNIIDIIIGFIGMIFIISKFSLLLASFVVIYQIVYFSIATAFRRKTVSVNREKNIIDEQLTGLTFEVINNIRSIKVLNMGSGLIGSIKEINFRLLKKIEESYFWYHGQILARTSWEGLTRILLFSFVIYGIFQGHYEVGFLVLFSGYFTNLTTSVNDLSSAAQDIAIAKSDIGRLMDLLQTPINIDIEKNKTSFPTNWEKISVKNLSFAYGDNNALTNIDFEIKRGEKIGIVGLSGAGKSTLFKLLLKEHEATEGDIYIGDTALKTIKKSDYLKHVAAVLQETEVFNMTLKKNILLANMAEEQNKSLFEKSIHTSHVKDFLSKLPNGVESIIGEKGVKLSGGEKQRVGIARAIFKNPQILLLDEATSHLDVESEGKIKDSLHEFFQGVTAIVIAHRLSTIKEMDKIIVIEGGKILESGTFDELYTKDARFREFWDKQSLQ